MSILVRRSTLLLGILIIASVSAQRAQSVESPVGNWTGVIKQARRNIVVKLTVTSLQEGARSGEMRWGTPRTCVLQTEYSGIDNSLYTFNISGTNGGWCDLYRDGTLVLEMSPQKQGSVSFTLADKIGANTEQGTLAAATAKLNRSALARYQVSK